jgi:hypothetical protein
MKDDLRYTPSDCFETFPSPELHRALPRLEEIGKQYYDQRAAIMLKRNEGLTKTYNRFHDPDTRDPVITELRELHDAIDRAVLDAYEWTDICPACEFILDYEDDEEDVPGKANRRRKPWRYRWADAVRDEVLGRLLELNARRAREEVLAGATGAKTRRSDGRTKVAKKRGRASGAPLLDT